MADFAEKCCLCDNTQQEGSKKIAAIHTMKCFLSDKRPGWKHFQVEEPSSYAGQYFSCVGSYWTDKAIIRAKRYLQDDKLPWFCMACIGLTCEECGQELRAAPGLGTYGHDGSIGHAPAFTPRVKSCEC